MPLCSMLEQQDLCETNSNSNKKNLAMRTFSAINTDRIPYHVISTDIHRKSIKSSTPKQLPPNSHHSNYNQISPTNANAHQNNQLYTINPTLAIDINNINAQTSSPYDNIDVDFNPFIEVKDGFDEIDSLIDAITIGESAQELIVGQSMNYNMNPPKSPSNTMKSNKKRKKKRQKRNNRYNDIGYEPNSMCRAQGNIQISKSLTESIVPCSVKEKHLYNMYTFMDKSYSLSLNMLKNERIKIVNYDLHSSLNNEVLYCVITKQDGITNKSRGYKWRMINKLYTANEIKVEYGINADQLPTTWRNTERFANELLAGDEIKTMLMDQKERERIINSCQWHKVNVFNRVNNKRRMTLSMTKPEFMRQCSLFSNHYQTQKNLHLIPILMFNKENNEYWIEHVWIMRIDENINIGIAFRYNRNKGVIRVSGIHLDKQYLANQHQLVLPQHNCRCLQHFNSHISDLKIGNPDDLQNKINYYKQVIDDLSSYKEQMKEFMNIEANVNNIYRLQALQQRISASVTAPNDAPLLQSPQMYNLHDTTHSVAAAQANNYRNSNNMTYSRSPSYVMNANYF